MLFNTQILLAKLLGLAGDQSPSPGTGQNKLHYCVVEGRQTLVYAKCLPQSNPLLFGLAWLSARVLGWRLLRDRREKIAPVTSDRRVSDPVAISLKLVIISLAMKAMPVAATTPVFFASSDTDATIVTQLGVVPENGLVPLVMPIAITDPGHAHIAQANHHPFEAEAGRAVLHISDVEFSARYKSALTLLQRHYRKRNSDPGHLATDFEEIAAYLAARPQSYELLMSLEGQRWSLNYQAGQFRTDVRGNVLQVNAVRIYFDPRSAAMLKNHKECAVDRGHCVASPADALIHELIHAQIALLDSSRFLRQGGMNGVVYPYQHEREVIGRESEIYSAMSKLDSRKRPLRTAHTGQLVSSDCATCLGG